MNQSNLHLYTVCLFFQFDPIENSASENWRIFSEELYLTTGCDIEQALDQATRQFDVDKLHMDSKQQTIKQQLVYSDAWKASEYDANVLENSNCFTKIHEIYFEFDHPLSFDSFYKQRLPGSRSAAPFMDDICFYSHKARYIELRGKLPNG